MSVTTMVDVERKLDPEGKEILVVTTPKTNCTYYIQKSVDGFTFYDILVDHGSVPKGLSGKYTGPDNALKALTKHIHQMKDTATVKRDKYQAERKKRNATKLRTDDEG